MQSIRSLETSLVTLADQLSYAKRYKRFNQIPHIEGEIAYAKDRLQELQPHS